MNPYYADDLVTLYLGDCREVAEWLSADVLVTDPPYGRAWSQPAIRGPHGGRGHPGIAGDQDMAARDAALALWGGKLAVVFGSPLMAPPPGTRWVLPYQKPPDAGLFGAVAGFRRDWEVVYLIGPWPRQPPERSSMLRTAAPSVTSLTAARYRNDRGSGHPHAKPADVMETLVTVCPAGMIADPFAGAGATLVAARNQGRHVVGVEIDERYCEAAAKRLAQGVLIA